MAFGNWARRVITCVAQAWHPLPHGCRLHSASMLRYAPPHHHHSWVRGQRAPAAAASLLSAADAAGACMASWDAWCLRGILRRAASGGRAAACGPGGAALPVHVRIHIGVHGVGGPRAARPVLRDVGRGDDVGGHDVGVLLGPCKVVHHHHPGALQWTVRHRP